MDVRSPGTELRNKRNSDAEEIEFQIASICKPVVDTSEPSKTESRRAHSVYIWIMLL